MTRLAVIATAALLAVALGLTAASLWPHGDQPGPRLPSEAEADAAFAACRKAGASDSGECALWVLAATENTPARFDDAATRWVRWDRAGRPCGTVPGEAIPA